FFFQAEDGIRDFHVTGVQTCALPISPPAETAKNAVPIAEQLGQVTPRRTRPHDPKHRFDKHAVVAARRAARTLVADDVLRYPLQIGRASCRERVKMSLDAVSVIINMM